MNRKIMAITLTIIFVISSIIVSGKFENNTINESESIIEEIDVKIAMMSEIPLGWDKNAAKWYGPVLNDYVWTVGNKTYKYVITPINDDDILDGSLTIDNYDALLVPGGGVGDELSITKGFFSKIRPNVIKWKKNIVDFIKSGGGYIGYCGGTALMCDLGKEPETFLEHAYEKSTIGASDVKVYWKADGPSVFLDAWSAYTDETHGYPQYNGLCFDIPLDKTHPITDDYIGDTCRIRWIGGASLIIPENISSSATVLGYYPEEEISENESTRIPVWKYTGGVFGILKGYFRGLKWLKEHNMPLSDGLVASIDFRYDWELTEEYATLNYSNKPCMVAEVYPNENEGRLVLDTFHPERNVWWGGRFDVSPDNDKNCVADGFYKLVDYTPFDETPEDETTHTWWIVRREIAWAAKVPENDLPPIYGPSQVCDIAPYEQPLNFSIRAGVEASDSITSLDLFYRYSTDNNTFTNWTLFETDNNCLDGWDWEFTSPSGLGYYQFCSIRNVIYDSIVETETLPIGPDAVALIVG